MDCKFPCCGSAWNAYRDTDGVTTALVTRDTPSIMEASYSEGAQSCEILDKEKFNADKVFSQGGRQVRKRS